MPVETSVIAQILWIGAMIGLLWGGCLSIFTMIGAHRFYLRASKALFITPVVNMAKRNAKFFWGMAFGALLLMLFLSR